ncbi:class I adenylate-forming enzyme family protein [Leifsonia sp. NCR5]|uniref:class I adenylate-forming enzyme family protein n=1 Tax=Leifsonia sp. NCR5 TaxID=1978342 RepID=UPI00211A2882|nr:fatty acid--CoA ligase family protein [Leifsonia sp. NCR5]
MTGVIVPLVGAGSATAGAARELIDRIHSVRAAGDVPLVGDDRWPEEQWRQVRATAEAAGPLPGIGWATLTSGSTGAPRIVVRTAESWSASFAAVDALLGVQDGDVLALPAPAASSLSLFSIARATEGGPELLMPGGHAVVVSDFADATLFHGTPRALRTILDAGPAATPLLRAALVGGADLDAGTRARAEERGIRVVAYYGAAELSFVAVDHGDGLRPFPGVEVEIRDGELWVRSPYAASGYLGGDGPLRRDGAWCTVGDRAEIVDGRIRLSGRADDAILTAAATVVPAEVEAALLGLPGVTDAVVFGLPNDGVGALVAAVVELARGGAEGEVLAGELRAQARAVLAPTHVPRRWFAMDALPRTASGKPARAELLRSVLTGEVSGL